MSRPVDTPSAADFFCGGGGASKGVISAGVDLRFAANHDAVAIATHAHHHPHVDHYQVDLVDYDVAKMPRVQLAHFSPSCVHHSQANAKKVYEQPATLFDHLTGDGPEPEARSGYASSERSRVTMSCVIRYADAHRPDLMVVELSTERWWSPPFRCWSASMWSLWTCPQRRALRCLPQQKVADRLMQKPPARFGPGACAGS